MINSVIWGNAVATESQVHCDGTLDVSYTGIEGGVAGITGAGTINDNGGNQNFSSSDSVFVDPVDPASRRPPTATITFRPTVWPSTRATIQRPPMPA